MIPTIITSNALKRSATSVMPNGDGHAAIDALPRGLRHLAGVEVDARVHRLGAHHRREVAVAAAHVEQRARQLHAGEQRRLGGADQRAVHRHRPQVAIDEVSAVAANHPEIDLS